MHGTMNLKLAIFTLSENATSTLQAYLLYNINIYKNNASIKRCE
jgi:hypothetical protein